MKYIENIILFFTAVVLIGCLSLIVTTANKGMKKKQEKARSDYYECKRKGYDVEFCFKTFNPKID